jgi:hypothetical protein
MPIPTRTVLDHEAVDYVEDPHTAGRLYLELSDQLADNSLSAGDRAKTKRALNRLDESWPDAPLVAAEASEQELGGLDGRLRKRRDLHRAENKITADQAAKARAKRRRDERGGHRDTASSSKRDTASSARSRGVSRRRSPQQRAVQSAIDATTAPVGGWSDLIVKGLGASVALVIVGALLTSANGGKAGGSAVELLAGGVRNAVDIIVRPVDPIAAVRDGRILSQPAKPATAKKTSKKKK